MRAVDEWIVRDGVVIVLGLDYSRFFGAGMRAFVSPRLGVQFDANARTRLRPPIRRAATGAMCRAWPRLKPADRFQTTDAQPVAFVDGRAVMERSRRFEFGVERVLDNESSIEATAFLDMTRVAASAC